MNALRCLCTVPARELPRRKALMNSYTASFRAVRLGMRCSLGGGGDAAQFGGVIIEKGSARRRRLHGFVHLVIPRASPGSAKEPPRRRGIATLGIHLNLRALH